jgi:hypothetical protein
MAKHEIYIVVDNIRCCIPEKLAIIVKYVIIKVANCNHYYQYFDFYTSYLFTLTVLIAKRQHMKGMIRITGQ